MKLSKKNDPKRIALLLGVLAGLAGVWSATGCDRRSVEGTPEAKDKATVRAQQSQYSAAQPVPSFDFSLERQATIDLYLIRNDTVSTHSVVFSDQGNILFDCPSIGYGLPYDTSLTNPLKSEWKHSSAHQAVAVGSAVTGQAEPNGVYASTNTSATWMFCVDESGLATPVYTESKLSVFPFAVDIDYDKGFVAPRSGAKSSINIDLRKK